MTGGGGREYALGGREREGVVRLVGEESVGMGGGAKRDGGGRPCLA